MNQPNSDTKLQTVSLADIREEVEQDWENGKKFEPEEPKIVLPHNLADHWESPFERRVAELENTLVQVGSSRHAIDGAAFLQEISGQLTEAALPEWLELKDLYTSAGLDLFMFFEHASLDRDGRRLPWYVVLHGHALEATAAGIPEECEWTLERANTQNYRRQPYEPGEGAQLVKRLQAQASTPQQPEKRKRLMGFVSRPLWSSWLPNFITSRWQPETARSAIVKV